MPRGRFPTAIFSTTPPGLGIDDNDVATGLVRHIDMRAEGASAGADVAVEAGVEDEPPQAPPASRRR